MSEPFLITGLPRSRTAWLAAAANNDQSVCWHEPLAWLDRWQDVFTVWSNQRHPYIGISDSALGFHLPEIIAKAKPRILLVERDIAQVEQSGAALGIPPGNYLSLLQLYLRFEHPSIRRVRYEALADDQVVMQCLSYLMPNAACSPDRIAALQRLNVQTDMARVRAHARKADIVAVLGAEIAAQITAGR